MTAASAGAAGFHDGGASLGEIERNGAAEPLRAAGDHGIMGIGDGFIPALMDMSRVHEVARVTTEAAHDECRRLRETHGWCVGVSSGANMIAARAFTRPDRTVVTLWPDSADRYVSVGLGPVGKGARGCPLAQVCERRRALVTIG